MAVFKQYKLKDGTKKWLFKAYIGIDDVTGKQVTTTRRGFNTRKEAAAAEIRMQHEIMENGFNKTKITTFGELYELWIEQYRLTVKPSTIAIAVRYAKNHILPIFGNVRLDKLTVSFCQKAVNQWYKSYKQYPYMRKQTAQILKYGISMELIDSNPMAKTTLPRKKEEEKKTNFFTKEELNTFLQIAEKVTSYKMFCFFRLLAYTGMRKSEGLGLQWNDIDFEEGTLSIGRTIALDEHDQTVIQEPKTKNSIRKISIDQITMSILKTWKIKQKEIYLQLGYNVSGKKQFVFTNKSNGVYYPQAVNDWLYHINSKTSLTKVTPHGFRHTHCSLLFEAGASIQEVQERLGHKDIMTTMNIYAHVTEKTIKKTGEKFAEYMQN